MNKRKKAANGSRKLHQAKNWGTKEKKKKKKNKKTYSRQGGLKNRLTKKYWGWKRVGALDKTKKD